MRRVLDRVLDRALGAAAERAAAPGRIRFTERQLYYELCRVLLPRPAGPRRALFTVPAPVGYDRYLTLLRRRGGVPGLLADRPPAAPLAGPPDLYDYGLPRLLVCQHRSIAAMLRANDLHLESACPVYAAADLPLSRRLVTALAAGDATVYVLHDASSDGLAVAAAVRDGLTDADADADADAAGGSGDGRGIRVSALGLRPRHAAALHVTALRGPPPERVVAGGAGPAGYRPGGGPPRPAPAAPPAAGGLAPWERRWLAAGRIAEVAAVPPARLLRTVHRLVRDRAARAPRPVPARAVGFLSWPIS